MAKLLSAGAAMLSETCPKCGTPLFRLKDGNVVCVSCDRNQKQAAPDTSAAAMEPKERADPTERLNRVLSAKLSLLIDALERTEDPNEIKNILSCVRDVLDMLRGR